MGALGKWKSTQGVDTTQGVIWKQLLIYFFPILLGTFFQQLYNTADAVIVGQFVGKEALAAVGGTTNVIINFLVNLFVGLSSGTTVIVSQYYGAQKTKEVSQAVHTSVALAIVAGAVMMVIGLVVAPYALAAMSTPPEIMEYALIYIRIYFVGMIPSFLYNMGSGILRAVGDTKRPLYFLAVACMTNIVLDLLFVVVFKWGVAGVGIATMISQVVSAVLVILALLKPGTVYQITIKEIRFCKQLLKEIVRVGAPAGIQSDMYSISNILIQSSINSFGTNTIAAWTAFGKIDGFYWMIIGAFGISITTFSGQNFGAQQYDRIRKGVKVCMLLALGVTAIVSSLVCGFASPLLSLFTNDAEVLSKGIAITWSMAPFYFTYILIELLSGVIRGTGDSFIPLMITCGGICVLRLLWIFLVLPVYPQFETVIFSYPMTWVVTSLLFLIYYMRGGWLRRQIVKRGYEPEPIKQKRARAR